MSYNYKSAIISGATGTATVLPFVDGKTFKIHGLAVSSSGAGSFSLQDAASVELLGGETVAAGNTTVIYPISVIPYASASGGGLVSMVNSTGKQLSGRLIYAEYNG